MLRNFLCQRCYLAAFQRGARAFEHDVSQHLDQALLPVFDALLQRPILLLQILFVFGDRRR